MRNKLGDCTASLKVSSAPAYFLGGQAPNRDLHVSICRYLAANYFNEG